MGFFSGWSTVPGIDKLNSEIDGLQYGDYVRGGGEKVVRRDAQQLLKGKKGFYDTGLGAQVRASALSDRANNAVVDDRRIGDMFSSAPGMYNDTYVRAMKEAGGRQRDQETQSLLADLGMEGSQYLIGLNRQDRGNQQDYNNSRSEYELKKKELESRNKLDGTKQTGGFIGGLKSILDIGASFTPGGAFAKLGAGAFRGFAGGGNTLGGPGSGGR